MPKPMYPIRMGEICGARLVSSNRDGNSPDASYRGLRLLAAARRAIRYWSLLLGAVGRKSVDDFYVAAALARRTRPIRSLPELNSPPDIGTQVTQL
jgi:hypothetical protein